jgi:hypothetical protein
MAGFWIAWECGLTRKREVLLIAKRLKVSAREAAAMCMEVWEWAGDQSIDGLVVGLDPADVSAAVGISGIGEAMKQAAWIFHSDGAIQFPNWGRFNSRSAKQRLQAAERKRRQRDRGVTRV